jgi:hypothetical protein
MIAIAKKDNKIIVKKTTVAVKVKVKEVSKKTPFNKKNVK